MKIKQTRNTLSDTYLDAVRIRQVVFVKGQGVPMSLEIDENEAYCLHFVLYDEQGQAAATCRICQIKTIVKRHYNAWRYSQPIKDKILENFS